MNEEIVLPPGAQLLPNAQLNEEQREAALEASVSDAILHYLVGHKSLYGHYPERVILPPNSKVKPGTLYVSDHFRLNASESKNRDTGAMTAFVYAISAEPPVQVELVIAAEPVEPVLIETYKPSSGALIADIARQMRTAGNVTNPFKDE